MGRVHGLVERIQWVRKIILAVIDSFEMAYKETKVDIHVLKNRCSDGRPPADSLEHATAGAVPRSRGSNERALGWYSGGASKEYCPHDLAASATYSFCKFLGQSCLLGRQAQFLPSALQRLPQHQVSANPAGRRRELL